LPYHRYGESKSGFLGKVYELADFVSPTPETNQTQTPPCDQGRIVLCMHSAQCSEHSFF
jgi:hypothetical protein